MPRYIHRTLETTLRRAAREFPALLVTGPRQSGKTTILQHCFRETHRFVYFDEPDVRALALSDPRLFLAQYPPPVVLDEIQYVPELLHYIKRDVDAHREEKGRYLLSGSQSFPLMQGISETLAGRIAILTLLSLSAAERARAPEAQPFWETDGFLRAPEELLNPEQVFSDILRSGFPELVAEPQRDVRLWMASYVQTYLERDIRSMKNIANLADFHRFLVALAARTAQILNISEVARDIGISVNTARSWLSVLEASFQIVLLRPYYANVGKRLVKSPKLYFLDAALPAYLTGLFDARHAFLGPMGGALLENAVFGEIYRAFVHRGQEPRIYFWRTAGGHEVDFVLDLGHQIVPVEVKLTATPKPPLARNLLKFKELFGPKAPRGFLVCLSPRSFFLSEGVVALSYRHLYTAER